MNPSKRINITEFFADFRAMINAIPLANQSASHAVCADCGSRLFLIHGKHSSKWFFTHEGLAGCEGSRPIFFETREEAEKSETVFK